MNPNGMPVVRHAVLRSEGDLPVVLRDRDPISAGIDEGGQHRDSDVEVAPRSLTVEVPRLREMDGRIDLWKHVAITETCAALVGDGSGRERESDQGCTGRCGQQLLEL